jgi:hypothetical protein
VKIFGVQHDVKPAPIVLHDIAFAQAAGDNLGHSISLFIERAFEAREGI